MDLYEQLVQQCNSSVSNNASLISESAYNSTIFQNENATNIESFIHKLNTNLNGGKSKESLHFLLLLLPQCSVETVKKHGDKWFKMCFSQLESKNLMYKPALCLIISILVKASESIGDLRKNIGKCLRESHFSGIIHKLADADQFVDKKFDVLYELLRVYPGSLLTHTNSIEKKALNFLSKSSNPSTEAAIYGAGKLFCALKGAKIDKLLSIGHIAANFILERGIIESEDYSSLVDEKHLNCVDELADLSVVDDPLRRIFVAVACLSNVFTFIGAFLRSSPAGSALFNPRDVLGLPLRIIRVDLKAVRKLKGQEHAYLASILPSLHQRALKHIDSILQYSGESFDLVHGVLLDHLTAIVKASRPSKSVNKNKFTSQSDETRIRAYECLLNHVEICNGCYPMPYNLCTSLVTDLLPTKEGLKLRKVRGQSLSNLGVKKKSKKKGYTTEQSDSCAIENEKIIFASNDGVVTAALKLVSKWVQVGHHTLSTRCLEEIGKCLLALTPFPVDGAYAFPVVRASYFESLINLAMYPHPSCPPNYAKINHALTTGMADVDPNVSAVCKGGLGTLSFILTNPQVSIFYDYVSLREKKGVKEDAAIEESDSEVSDDEDEVVENGVASECEEMEVDVEDEDAWKRMCEKKNSEAKAPDSVLNGESKFDESGDSTLAAVQSAKDRSGIDSNFSRDNFEHKCKEVGPNTNNELVDLVSDPECIEIDNAIDGIVEIPVEESNKVGEDARISKRKNKVDKQKKSKKKKSNDEVDSVETSQSLQDQPQDVAINEMLSTFVNADPDSD